MQIQGDEQGRSCRHGRGEEHGREWSSPCVLGMAGREGFQLRTSRMAAASRRRAGPAARESGMSRGRAWMSRGGAEEEQDRREEQERRAGGGGPAAGTSEWCPLPSNPPALPSNPPALPSCGCARAWRRGNSSRAPIWRAKIGRARAHPARLRAASAPAERAYAPPRAA